MCIIHISIESHMGVDGRLVCQTQGTWGAGVDPSVTRVPTSPTVPRFKQFGVPFTPM